MKKIFKYYSKVILKYKKFLIGSCIITLLIGLIQVALPLYFKFYVDSLDTNTNFSRVLFYLLIFAGFIICSVLVQITWHYLLTKFGGYILLELREKLMNKLYDLDYEKIIQFDKEKLKNILFYDTLNIFRCMGNYIIQLSVKSLIIISIFIILVFVNINIFLIVLFSFISGLTISYFSQKKIEISSKIVNKELKNTNIFLNSYVDNLKLIKTNPIYDYYLKSHINVTNNFIKTSVKNDKTTVFYKSIIENLNYLFLIILTTVLIIYSAGNYTIGNVILLMFYAGTVFQFSQEIETLIVSIGENIPSFEHVNNILETGININENKLLNNFETIFLNNVSFRFQNNNNFFFENTSFNFKKGDRVKLTGQNGTGKTTFVNLVTGLVKPVNGEILINGINVSDIDKKIRSEKILYIGQDETFIDGTLKNYFDIICGKEMDDVLIADKLKFMDFFENGVYDINKIKLDQKGELISLGQRKKLLIIKLLLNLSRADIVILDEIDANLDNKTKSLFEDIRRTIFVNNDKIIFEISHNFHDRGIYSRILEFKNSKITEINC